MPLIGTYYLHGTTTTTTITTTGFFKGSGPFPSGFNGGFSRYNGDHPQHQQRHY